MPGLANAPRRKHTCRPKRLFDREEGSCGFVSSRDGTPGLLFARLAPTDRIEWYSEQLRRGTEFRILRSASLAALDVSRHGKPLARITTSLNNPALTTLVAAVVERDADKLQVTIAGGTFEDSAYPRPVRLPVVVEDVAAQVISGEPIVRGAGPHVVATVDVEDGTTYLHRFPTRRAADVLLARNLAADRAFATCDSQR